MTDSSVTLCDLWGGASYGMLRLLHVHLVQHDILWPGGGFCALYCEIWNLREGLTFL